MAVRVDIGHPVVTTLEMQSIWGDNAIEPMVRRARGSGTRRGGVGDNAHDLGLIARGLAIGRERRAWRCHPGRDRQRLSKCGSAERAGKNPAPEEDSAAEEPAGCTEILGAGRRVTRSYHSCSCAAFG